MPIINSILTLFNLKRLHQIEETQTNPDKFQEEGLFKLIQKAENTIWGKRFDFSSIRTIRDFQDRVPVSEYDDLKSYIERMVKGEPDVLWPGQIRWYAKSSGTTSDKSKFIPVSKEAIEDNHIKAAKDIIILYTAQKPESKLIHGKTLTLGGSTQVSKLNGQSQVGDLSAIYIQNVPFWVSLLRTPEPEIALISEFEEKINRIAETSTYENVTCFMGVPSWNLVLLRHILKHTGKENILEVWPNLELFVHGGVGFDPYREQYEKLIPSKKMSYMETYNASEGFFAIQNELDKPGMLLMADYGIFYEFIPLDELGKSHPKALTIGEVETDVNYALAITTNAGLWRYLIGDTVKFISTYPHKIIISGRTKHFINVFGEELMVDNANKALKTACQKTDSVISEYTAAPVYMTDNSKGRHQWLIEFEKSPVSVEDFAQILDEELQQLNSDYEAKRHKNITLARLEIIEGKPGLFLNWMKGKGKLGGQNKVPRLSNQREYIEPLLELNASL